MKPVSGGSPPRESRIIGRIAVRRGAFAHDVDRVLILVALFALRVMKAAEVITRYVLSARRVRDGEN